MAEKTRLLILFGGVSSEHEISRASAASVLEHIDKGKYEITTVGITREGRWLATKADSSAIADGSWEKADGNIKVTLATDGSRMLLAEREARNLSPMTQVDVMFPVLHGKNGEDGTVQGLAQIAGVPYVGSDATSSAACMDKSITKAMVDMAGGVNQAKCCIVHRLGCNVTQAAETIENFFEGELPLFVKPASAGSSVGITKVKSWGQITEALEIAFAEDGKALVEEAITGREIECAVLGNDAPEASCLGEIHAANEFYDYEAKYEDATSMTSIVTGLDEAKENEIRDTALRIYQIMGCRGMARVDFFLMPNGKVIFNEINTIPGFTKISMYPQMWEASGLGYSQLIDELIRLALEDKTV